MIQLYLFTIQMTDELIRKNFKKKYDVELKTNE